MRNFPAHHVWLLEDTFSGDCTFRYPTSVTHVGFSIFVWLPSWFLKSTVCPRHLLFCWFTTCPSHSHQLWDLTKHILPLWRRSTSTWRDESPPFTLPGPSNWFEQRIGPRLFHENNSWTHVKKINSAQRNQNPFQYQIPVYKPRFCTGSVHIGVPHGPTMCSILSTKPWQNLSGTGIKSRSIIWTNGIGQHATYGNFQDIGFI